MRLAWGCGIECAFDRIVEGSASRRRPHGTPLRFGGDVYIHNGRDIAELVPPLYRAESESGSGSGSGSGSKSQPKQNTAPENRCSCASPAKPKRSAGTSLPNCSCKRPRKDRRLLHPARKVFDADVMAEGVEVRLWPKATASPHSA